MKLFFKFGLFSLLTLLLFAQAQDDTSITLVLENVGASAWKVTSLEGADGIAEVDTDNPELSLLVGMRYVFDLSAVNSQVHPFEFRDAEDNVLLAQGANAGSLEEDSDIAFESDDEHVAFTLTPELAELLAYYRCSIHSGMKGMISVVSE